MLADSSPLWAQKSSIPTLNQPMCDMEEDDDDTSSMDSNDRQLLQQLLKKVSNERKKQVQTESKQVIFPSSDDMPILPEPTLDNHVLSVSTKDSSNSVLELKTQVSNESISSNAPFDVHMSHTLKGIAADTGNNSKEISSSFDLAVSKHRSNNPHVTYEKILSSSDSSDDESESKCEVHSESTLPSDSSDDESQIMVTNLNGSKAIKKFHSKKILEESSTSSTVSDKMDCNNSIPLPISHNRIPKISTKKKSTVKKTVAKPVLKNNRKTNVLVKANKKLVPIVTPVMNTKKMSKVLVSDNTDEKKCFHEVHNLRMNDVKSYCISTFLHEVCDNCSVSVQTLSSCVYCPNWKTCRYFLCSPCHGRKCSKESVPKYELKRRRK